MSCRHGREEGGKRRKTQVPEPYEQGRNKALFLEHNNRHICSSVEDRKNTDVDLKTPGESKQYSRWEPSCHVRPWFCLTSCVRPWWVMDMFSYWPSCTRMDFMEWYVCSVILYLVSTPICGSLQFSDWARLHQNPSCKKSADGPALRELLNLRWNPLDTVASTVHLF